MQAPQAPVIIQLPRHQLLIQIVAHFSPRSSRYSDQAYWKEADRQAALERGIRYRVNRRGTKQRPLTEHQRYINRCRSKARARGEHAFHVVKRLWGFSKVRYRGLAKNTARLYTAFALANLYMLRRRLLPREWCL